MKSLRRFIRRNKALTAFLFLLMIRLIFILFPAVYEVVYFNSLFPALRKFQAWFYPIWIIPGYFVLILLIIGLIFYYFFRRKSFRNFLQSVLNLCFAIAAIFMFCFGLQYADKGIADRMRLKKAPQSIDLAQLYYESMNRAIEYRDRIPGIESTENITELHYKISQDSLQKYLVQVLAPIGYSVSGQNQIIREIPYSFLRKLSISGIYNPFTGECNVEGGLPTILKSFVMAHELAHAAGVTSEGEANFIAWLSLSNSGDPYLEYAASYFIWRQIAKPVNQQLSTNELEQLATSIPDELQKDRIAIYAILNEEKPWYPELSNKLNDSYLKIQGIESGVDDYDKFLELYVRWISSNSPQ